ncbi:helix-turn-helix transcriptional regulator [Ponticaulis sp.]|uniref:ArsR/SmtB family transcription factor n=1 Tax=Ponticaulis sp. TaxID=2020902 RepID=UPI000B70C808|nr:metalloregulator ArsR/SmtB family transcription factor [Ponticaulis sp.]MAI89664.1 transcriptional regulator [Ponticaulis sp.]OUY00684.1 MAG: transcriptional regulator [Hyphomonadaceae bacterium TMED5]|tara:strand:+ start:127352 stop:127693 length:342 start_codon:yes stop_codon:yes gene_type:complete
MLSEAYENKIFKALAAPVRREIMDALRDNPMTTGELADRFSQIDRTTVMQHMRVLEAADLIIPVKRGRVRWNHLNPMPIKAIHDRWIGPMAASAVDKLGKLKADLEDEVEPAK